MIKFLNRLFGSGGNVKVPAPQPWPKLTPRARVLALRGKEYGYVPEQEQTNIGLLILVKPGVQVNIYYTKMTVGTALTHPTLGKTQLFRKNVSAAELEKILANPRVHSGKGYRQLKGV